MAIAHPYSVHFFGLILLSAPSANLVAFNNAYRKIFNLPIWSSASTMYAEMLRKSIYRFTQRLQDSDNF